MEAQNQPDTRTPYVAVKQVIPGYASGQAKILAIVQAVLGGLVLVFGIVAFGVDTFTSVGGTSILVAIPVSWILDFFIYTVPTFNSCTKCVGQPGQTHTTTCSTATHFPGHGCMNDLQLNVTLIRLPV